MAEPAAVAIARDVQKWAIDESGEDPTGVRTKAWARKLTRGLQQHPMLRRMLFRRDGGVNATLLELERRGERHARRTSAIRQQHAANVGETDPDFDEQESAEDYARAVAQMTGEWWVRTTQKLIATKIDEYFLLTPERVMHGHRRWAFQRRPDPPRGWRRYLHQEKEMWWNPAANKMQLEGPPGWSVEEEVKAPAAREPPVALLDVGSCSNPFGAWPYMIQPLALDLKPMHPSVYQADFFELPVVDAKDAAGAEPQEGPQRFTVDDDGDLVSLTAGSFDCAVLSLVLSYVPDPQKRIEMVSKIRRCLGDERSLFFLVEVGSALATARWYKGDAVYEWGRAIEKAGFKLLVYEDTVTDRGKKPFEVHQWVFETVPVKPDIKLEPLLSPRDMW